MNQLNQLKKCKYIDKNDLYPCFKTNVIYYYRVQPYLDTNVCFIYNDNIQNKDAKCCGIWILDIFNKSFIDIKKERAQKLNKLNVLNGTL